MKYLIPAVALALLLSGCGGSTNTVSRQAGMASRTTTPERLIPDSPPASQAESSEETEPVSRVLSSLTAVVSDGRSLRLDAIGTLREDRKDHCGIREIQVYENGALLQSITASTAPLHSGAEGTTESASVEGAMVVRDMNFDGYDDVELSDWISSGNDPHHFWLWDTGAGEYRYSFTLRGASANAETREIVSSYHEGNLDYTDTYQYQGRSLILLRRHTADWKNGTEDFPLEDWYEFQDGVEVLLREEFTDYNEDGIAMREVRELVDGILTPVRIEQLEVIDGELRVVSVTAVEPPQPVPAEGDYPEGLYSGDYYYGEEYPEGFFPEGELPEPYPWEAYLEPPVETDLPDEAV